MTELKRTQNTEDFTDDFDYYLWLKNKTYEYHGTTRHMLLQILYDMEFYSLVPNDDNRGMDGIALREQYLYELNEEGSRQGPSFVYSPDVKLFNAIDRMAGIPIVPQGPCKMLEMLVALTDRMVFRIDDGEQGNVFIHIFWELIENLGLLGYTDEFMNETKVYEIRRKIDKFLERRYRKDGKGGLFPLKNVTVSVIGNKDQREVEIAYQMNAYLLERYPLQKSD